MLILVTLELIIGIFIQLKVVSCWRYPQLQVCDNYSDLTKREVNIIEILIIAD